MQFNKHLTKFAAAVAALMMVMSPLAGVFAGGLVGTAKANQNDVSSGTSLEEGLTVEDPEPGVTTAHAWYEAGGSSSAASGSKITVSYNTAADDATEGIDVSNVDASDVRRAGIDTDGDGSIEEDITVESTSISNDGKDVTFNLASSHDFDDTEYLVLVYEDVQHPDEGGAGGAELSYGGTSLIAGVGVPQSTPMVSAPDTYDGSAPYPEGITPQDASPGSTTSYVYRGGPASDASNVSVDEIRPSLPTGVDLSGVSASNVQALGIDTDSDGRIEDSLSASSVSGNGYAELTITFSSSVSVEPGEDIIAEFGNVTNPSESREFDVAMKYNSFASFGSETQILTETYAITGTVTDANGDAVSDASVDVDRQWTNQYDVTEVTTGSNGQYTVVVPATGDYSVDTTAAGYTSSTQTVSVSGDTTADASLETASYTYDATVEDSSGTAIEDATVELLDGSGNVVSSGTTDSTGQVSVAAPSGTYGVEVSASGYDSASGTADLSTSGDSGTFTLSESTYVIGGQVTDSSGNAVEGATVTLVDADGNTVKEASTDAEGAYSFSGVKSADYTVEVSAADYADTSKDVTVDGATTADFQLAQTVWTATYDRPSNATPGVVFAEFNKSGNATVTVEAHNSSSDSWETVIDAKQYEVDGSAETPHLVEVDLDDYASEDYDQYRVTVEDVEPSNTGVAEDSTGGGGMPGSGGGVPFAVVVVGAGLLLAGGAAIAFEE